MWFDSPEFLCEEHHSKVTLVYRLTTTFLDKYTDVVIGLTLVRDLVPC